MTFNPHAIHQFHAGSAFGDGVTNGLLFTQGLLRELGFRSEIYCVHVAPELSDRIRPVDAYEDRADQLLLLHHSMGHDHDAWVESLTARLAMVYHNITPATFFPPDSPDSVYSARGRRQLAAWRQRCAAAIGVSPYNAAELTSLGYDPVDTLPLLVDLEALRARPFDEDLLRRLDQDDAYTLLFVGRIVPNKGQHALIEAVDALRSMLHRPVRLVLAGGVSSPAYRDSLDALCAERGLGASVEFTGKVSDATLGALYRGCDAFVCLSEHEGFGMPLIEAMAHDLPVIAYASSGVADTVGKAALVLDDKSPERVAATCRILSSSPELRRRLVKAGRRHVGGFERHRLLDRLATFLRDRLAVDVPRIDATVGRTRGTRASSARWRIEGPFDSSYSLAQVNRHLALALKAAGHAVALHSTEGGGDFAPNPAFLASQPAVEALWRAGQDGAPNDVVLRDLYPPRVSGMRGHTRLLSCYGWEESGFPPEDVARFNRTLNLITTLSAYVARVLVANGVTVPIAVVGAGVDHIGRPPAVAPAASPGKGPFRFLHASSCFPRKGLDVLLAAWERAFTAKDGVTLIVKTFPNPHNRASAQIADLRQRVPRHAEIVLIDEDVDEAHMAGLYAACDAVVMPSRGEGFGLPMAEAMWFERPVITTGFGGQTDFCNDETAWLVDYRFAPADTHFGLPGSVWVEPDVDDLVRALRAVHEAPADVVRQRVAAASTLIRRDFTWAAVARRTQDAVAALDRRPAVEVLPSVDWIGPAGATEPATAAWTQEFPPASLRFVSLAESAAGTRRKNVGAAVLHFEGDVVDPTVSAALLERLHTTNIATCVVLPAPGDAAASIRASLATARHIVVTDIDALNRLKRIGLVDNTVLLVPDPEGWPALSRRLWAMLTAPAIRPLRDPASQADATLYSRRPSRSPL